MTNRLLSTDAAGTARLDVACPECGYAPTPHDRWVCAPDGCGFWWDTFSTAARCPQCDAQFIWTGCPACGTTSAHRAWYRSAV